MHRPLQNHILGKSQLREQFHVGYPYLMHCSQTPGVCLWKPESREEEFIWKERRGVSEVQIGVKSHTLTFTFRQLFPVVTGKTYSHITFQIWVLVLFWDPTGPTKAFHTAWHLWLSNESLLWQTPKSTWWNSHRLLHYSAVLGYINSNTSHTTSTKHK